MKKLLIMIAMLFATTIFAQNSTEWDVRYYGDNYRSSDSLQFAVGDSCTGIYVIPNNIIGIAVDSNWTASGIGFMVYNYLEEVWEPLDNEDGALVEYTIAIGSPIQLPVTDLAGIKRVKFYKVTSGSPVAQATAASSIQITTIRPN